MVRSLHGRSPTIKASASAEPHDQGASMILSGSKPGSGLPTNVFP